VRLSVCLSGGSLTVMQSTCGPFNPNRQEDGRGQAVRMHSSWNRRRQVLSIIEFRLRAYFSLSTPSQPYGYYWIHSSNSDLYEVS
jgi:hypothetical protein